MDFHLPSVRMLGTNNCGNTRHEVFKGCREFQYVLCCHDYDERLVANFAHQKILNTMAEINMCLLKEL